MTRPTLARDRAEALEIRQRVCAGWKNPTYRRLRQRLWLAQDDALTLIFMLERAHARIERMTPARKKRGRRG